MKPLKLWYAFVITDDGNHLLLIRQGTFSRLTNEKQSLSLKFYIAYIHNHADSTCINRAESNICRLL